MKVQSPTPTNGPARVVKFPPRTTETPAHRGRPGRRGWGDSAGEAQDSLAPDERHLADADDFRHRMWANAAALAFTPAIASAQACGFESWDGTYAGRPNIARANFLPNMINAEITYDAYKFQKYVRTVMHEMIHGLGVGSLAFRDPPAFANATAYLKYAGRPGSCPIEPL